MLGTEPQIIAEYVASGEVKLVFWPVLNHGRPSLLSTLAAECAGQHDGAAFWQMHTYLFENQSQLWRAERDFYLDAAATVGLDTAQFDRCLDDETAVATVQALDQARRDRGIRSQPVFDVGGQLLFGSQPFSVLADLLEANLP